MLSIALVVIGLAILISTNRSEGGSYQVFYGTVQDQAMAKVNEYDFNGHSYITIEQDDGTVEMFWISNNCPEYHAELGDTVMVEACEEEQFNGMIAYSVEVVSD